MSLQGLRGAVRKEGNRMQTFLPIMGAAIVLAGSVWAAETPSMPAKVDPKEIKTTESGLKYAVLKAGKGPGAVKNQEVTLHYTGWLESGKQFDTSRERNQPLKFLAGRKMVIPGFDEGIIGMAAGEQRQLIIPPKLGYGGKEVGDGLIPANSTLIFEIEMTELGGVFEPSEKPAKVDEKAIKKTQSGLKYAVLTEGKGDPVKKGQKATLHYSGWLEDGKKFDSSIDRGRPMTFPVGDERMIKGFNEGVEGMKAGEKRQVIIPAKLGYGAEGRPPVIPANATLIFEIQLIKVEE
jgi:peptidylprolyl isomerase